MSTEHEEVVDGEVLDLEPIAAGETLLASSDRSTIDAQIVTAKQYPRSVDHALKQALTLATLDEESAASCFYAVPRGGRTIEGPSTRLAEIMASSWGNLRVDADIVDENDTHVIAAAACLDLENNVAVRIRCRRRITDKHGKRFNEDMIGVTANAAVSIAYRNSVFKVIPGPLVRKVYRAARQAAVGKGGTLTQKRQAALDWFAKLNVTAEQVFALLEVRGVDDIGEDELATLRGLVNAIKSGETDVEEAFAPPEQEGEEEPREQDASAGDDSDEGDQADGERQKFEKPMTADQIPFALLLPLLLIMVGA